MKLIPKPHNLSFSAASLSFAVLFVLAGSAVPQVAVRAATITDSQDATVRVTIPEITPGPILPPGGGVCLNCPPIVPPTTPKPNPGPQTITIVPEPRGRIPQQTFTRSGRQVSMYTFSTSRPSFSGQTSIANARIFITINSSPTLYSTASANAGGYWFWTSPVPLANGFYAMSVMGQDAGDPTIAATANLEFAVATAEGQKPGEPNQPGQQPASSSGHSGVIPGSGTSVTPGSGGVPDAGNNGFLSIFVEIPDQYKIVDPGARVLVNLRLINNDSSHTPKPYNIAYTIENSEGKVILESTDTMTLGASLAFAKVFITNPYATPGLYTIIVRVGDADAVAAASDTFKIKDPSASSSPVRPFIPWEEVIALLLLLLLALIMVFAYYTAARKITAIKKQLDDEAKQRSKIEPH